MAQWALTMVKRKIVETLGLVIHHATCSDQELQPKKASVGLVQLYAASPSCNRNYIEKIYWISKLPEIATELCSIAAKPSALRKLGASVNGFHFMQPEWSCSGNQAPAAMPMSACQPAKLHSTAAHSRIHKTANTRAWQKCMLTTRTSYTEEWKGVECNALQLCVWVWSVVYTHVYTLVDAMYTCNNATVCTLIAPECL